MTFPDFTRKKIRFCAKEFDLISPSPNKRDALLADRSGKIFLINLYKPNDFPVILDKHSAPLNCLTYSTDGKHFLSSAKGGNVILWSAKTNKAKLKVGKKLEATFCMFSKNDEYFVYYDAALKTVFIFSVAKLEMVFFVRISDFFCSFQFRTMGFLEKTHSLYVVVYNFYATNNVLEIDLATFSTTLKCERWTCDLLDDHYKFNYSLPLFVFKRYMYENGNPKKKTKIGICVMDRAQTICVEENDVKGLQFSSDDNDLCLFTNDGLTIFCFWEPIKSFLLSFMLPLIKSRHVSIDTIFITWKAILKTKPQYLYFEKKQKQFMKNLRRMQVKK